MTYKTLPKPSSQNKQVREYIDAAKKGSHSRLIASLGSEWTVRSVGSTNKPRIFTTKEDAISYASESGGVIIFSDQDSE